MEESQRIVSGKLGEKLVCMLTQRYDTLSSKFRKRFVGILSVELDRDCAREWNSERVIVFQ